MEHALETMTNTSATTPAEVEGGIDPASSFILPTLYFSATFPIASHNSWASSRTAPQFATPALEDLEFHNAWMNASLSGSESDFDSDLELGSDVDVDHLSDIDSAGSAWEDSFDVVSNLSRARGQDAPSESEGWVPLGFSSHFSGRVQEYEPREYLF